MDITKILGGVLVALLGLGIYRSLHPSTSFAADGLDTRWDSAVQQSQASGKPTIVLFTADWCPACRALHRELASSEAQEELDHYYVFTIDLTNPSQQAARHAQQFGAKYIPLMIRYDANQKETDRTNSLPPDELIAWLKAGE